MTRVGTRWVGTSMTTGAVLLLLVAHGIIAPEPVGASECCQVCEAKEAACYNACEQMSHNEGGGDSLGACYETCDDELYYAPYACWAHCSYCGQPPDPARCFAFASGHYYGNCLWYFQGVCQEWQVLHDVWSWEVSSGFCT